MYVLIFLILVIIILLLCVNLRNLFNDSQELFSENTIPSFFKIKDFIYNLLFGAKKTEHVFVPLSEQPPENLENTHFRSVFTLDKSTKNTPDGFYNNL